MGSHRTQKGDQFLGGVRLLDEWPPLPNNIGKTRKIKTIDGQIRHFEIEDEIKQPQSKDDRKLVVLQKMRNVEDDRIEFRFGYYMLGIKPRASGRWVWGQFCLVIPKNDLIALMQEAQKKKWFKL